MATKLSATCFRVSCWDGNLNRVVPVTNKMSDLLDNCFIFRKSLRSLSRMDGVNATNVTTYKSGSTEEIFISVGSPYAPIKKEM